MNILSIVGLVTVVGSGVVAIYFEILKGIDAYAMYVDEKGVVIVVFGAIGAALLKSSTQDFKAAMSLVSRIFMNPLPATKIIDQLVEFSDIARKNGLIALESQQIKHPFLAKAVQLLVDGQKPELIAKTLEAESEAQTNREKLAASFWSYLGEVLPAMGMIGTLVGLVSLLADMSSQEKLTSGMSTALLTTLYGAVLANYIALPFANKIRVQSEFEELNRQIIIEGVAFIQTGGNPRVLVDLLASYIPPTDAQKLALNAK